MGRPELLAELGGALAHLTVERDERRLVGRLRRQLLGLDHGRRDHAVGLFEAHGEAAAQAGDQELGAGEPALLLVDAGDGAGRVEGRGVDLLGVAAL